MQVIFYHGDKIRDFAVELIDPVNGSFNLVFDPAQESLEVSDDDAERLIATGEWGNTPEKPASKKTSKTEKPKTES